MKDISSSFKLLIDNDTHLEKLAQWINQPTAITKDAYRLAVSLTLACLNQQLQSDIGRELTRRILAQHATTAKDAPDFGNDDTDIDNVSTEGHRLLGKMLPGKKSAIMQIIGRYVKLPSAKTDRLVGASAYMLFTKLALGLSNGVINWPVSLTELQEFAPELSQKDYVSIGAYSDSIFAVSAL
ncbi:hypothetical protein GCM10028807_26840 [Spirosoma daeguense]